MIQLLVFLVIITTKITSADLFKNPILESKPIYFERIPMGQVAPFTSHSLYKIQIENHEGHKIGQITVQSHFHNYENGVRDPSQPSGPANRNIVNALTGYSISHGWMTTTTDVEKKQLDEVVKTLNEKYGSSPLVQAPPPEEPYKEKVDLATDEFKESFKKDMKSKYQWNVKFE